MRRIPPWQNYDRMAASGEYGVPLEARGEAPSSAPGVDEAGFFHTALAGCRRVLDLGCGPGVLGPPGATLCGLDASPAMLTLARRSVVRRGNACLVRGAAEALPFVAGSFDGVVISGTLCSVPDPVPVLAEVARVTTPGARVAALVWEFGSIFAAEGARVDRSLRRRDDELSLHVISYLSHPYRIGHARYLLDTRYELVQALLDDPALPPGGRRPTSLTPDEIPPAMILDATYEEEAQFDPETLHAAFLRAGFSVVDLRVAISFDTPHVFGVFRRKE